MRNTSLHINSNHVISTCISHFGYQLPLHLLTGMPRRHQDMWSRSAPSRYHQDWKPPASGSDRASEGHTCWSLPDTRGTTSSQADTNTETWEDTREKSCRSHRPNSGKYKRSRAVRKGSPSQTYKKNTEANAKVYDLNQRTMHTPRSNKVVRRWRASFLRGDLLFADVRTAMEGLAEAQQHQGTFTSRTAELPCES